MILGGTTFRFNKLYNLSLLKEVLQFAVLPSHWLQGGKATPNSSTHKRARLRLAAFRTVAVRSVLLTTVSGWAHPAKRAKKIPEAVAPGILYDLEISCPTPPTA